MWFGPSEHAPEDVGHPSNGLLRASPPSVSELQHATSLATRDAVARLTRHPGGVRSSLGCSGGQEVSSENVEAARRLWTRAGIRDYDLEYTSGPFDDHYLVTVHDGTVGKIESIQPGGKRVELRPGAPRFYSVDGLFLTITNELAQLKTDTPFDKPRGTKILMKFKTDPKLGYPLWYRRDIVGAPHGARFDVIKITRRAAAPRLEKK